MAEKSVIEARLKALGVGEKQAKLIQSRVDSSNEKLNELGELLADSSSVSGYPDLTIFAAGSFGRGEAGPHSDLDLFFVHDNRKKSKVEDPNLKGIRLMSSVVRTVEDKMNFPAPSNDGQFMKIIELTDILNHLGGPDDDHRNHFTTRLLAMLEGRAIYRHDVFDAVVSGFVDTYLRDYKDHAEDFRPTFLVNDIIRFWKTLCLNYENRRNQSDPVKKIKAKIRNFKLKFSRMLTCYATVGLLSSYNSIERDDLISIFRISPIERLLALAERVPEVSDMVAKLINDYCWFLDLTAKDADALAVHFSTKEAKVEAFGRADRFGEALFEVLRRVSEKHDTLRHLLI